MDLKEIKAVIDLMTRNGLTEFELEKGEFKLRVARGGAGQPVVHTSIPAYHPPAAHAPTPIATAPSAPPSAPAGGESLPSINAPMVGTLYLAPSPDSPSYVKVGSEVNEDTVVCIIEAMKVMNEIKAEMRGVVAEIVGENGKPVEFGKPLFRIRPA
jgi:acetyl-CoA carboxylase biotin carboxyl carrier protein